MIVPDKIAIPALLPLLPLRDTVAFPGMSVPLLIGREKSIKAIEASIRGNKIIMMSAQRDPAIIDPGEGDIYGTGTVGIILRTIGQADGKIKVLVQGILRADVLGFTRNNSFIEATNRLFPDSAVSTDDDNVREIVRTVKEKLEVWSGGIKMPAEIMIVAETIEDPAKLSYLIAPNIGLEVVQAQKILETADPLERLRHIIKLLDSTLES